MFNFNNIDFKKTLSKNYYNFKESEYILKNLNLLYLFNFSYKNFLNSKLKELFNKIFPIYIYKKNFIIEFLNYNLTYPLKSVIYCINKGLTYSISLVFRVNLYSYELVNNKIFKKKIREEKFVIPFPYITENTTFIINGIEKTIVSKFTRAPGLYLIKEFEKNKKLFILKIVPDIGSEIDFVIDQDNILYLRCKKNKINILDILKSAGLNDEEIISKFYNFLHIDFDEDIIKLKFDSDIFLNYSLPYNIVDNLNNIIVKKNKIITLDDIEKVKNNNISSILIDKNFLIDKHLGCNLYKNNFKFAKISQNIDIDLLNKVKLYKIKNIKIIVYGSETHKSVCLNLKNFNTGVFESLENLNKFLISIKSNIFNFNILNFNQNYNEKNFYISLACRKKINYYFKKNFNFYNLSLIDVINIIKMLIAFKDGICKETETLNLGNLKISMVGEMLYEIFFDFFLKIKKKLERGFFDIEKNNLSKFFEISNLTSKIKNFFSVSRYCQYLDQVNILSELAHKRRVTFLGVIGVSKKYSGFNSRDLDASHYSRICPVETPEGINIGLVNSLALLCKVDKYNFLVAPYYKVFNGKFLKKWQYISVEKEMSSFIAEPLSVFKNFENIDILLSKYGDQILTINPKLTNYINILPYQMLSISTLLIPFIEHNDSNRALMASNMLRQSLPLLFPEKPLISTGLEMVAANNSSDLIFCKDKSVIDYFDSNFVFLKKILNIKDIYYYNYDVYFLIKYVSTNQKTCKSQRVSKNISKTMYKGDVLSEGNCTDCGELALGQNVIVAFMPWEGYNFEDSIIVSQKVLFDDRFTSLELTQIDINVLKISDTSEILTKNILSKDFEKINLNNFGLIKIGSTVYGGDALVGKACPIQDNFKEINPNHRLLYSIFLKNSEFNYYDTSFYLPWKFSKGVVLSLEVYFSKNSKLSEDDNILLKKQSKLLLNNKLRKYYLLKKKIKKMLKNFLINKKFFYKNSIKKIDKNFLKNINLKFIMKIKLFEKKYYEMFETLKKKTRFFLKIFIFLKKNMKENFFKDLPYKVDKLIKIIIISKKVLQVGDKMAGRYGNKGVVSKILPINEMPYIYGGRTIEVILNPLGVPSRMNIGQLLEVHLGFISMCLSWKIFDLLFQNNSFLKIKKLLSKIYNLNYNTKINLNSYNYFEILNLVNFFKNGFYFSVKPFSNFNENDINVLLKLVFSDNFLHDAGISENKKQIYIYDGRTGKRFDKKTTVGKMYLLKLNHLAEDKAHARSVGPYSMITQQPLKGKSKMGGQRVGEMEAWALEAYGAFYSLQEMFTIKSDDVLGRFKAYKNIVKNINDFSFSRPETFNVMMKNINSLSLYIRFNDY